MAFLGRSLILFRRTRFPKINGLACSNNNTKGLHSSYYWFSAPTEGEERLTRILTEKLNPTFVEVIDISGGCGSMYQITVESEAFKGVKTLQQHRMVNESLGDIVKSLHGLTLKTGEPCS